MKKTSILIALFAVIAAASAAKAEINMDFDGKLKPQSMHDIFAGSHQIIPQEALAQIPVPAPAQAEKKLDLFNNACGLVCVNGQLTDNCTCEPYPSWVDDNMPVDWNSIYQYIQNGNQNYCAPVASGPAWLGCYVVGAPINRAVATEVPGRAFMEMSAEQKKQLMAYYMLQGELKEAVAARATEYNFSPEILAFVSNAKTKILYDNKKVYITNGKALLVINDVNIMSTVKGQKSAASVIAAAAADSAVTGNVIAGGALIIGCMVSDPCWNAVGDGVSDASEWAHNGTHWWN